MTTLNLTAYKPAAATLGDAGQIASGFTAIETAVNAIDNTNFAAGLIFDPNKIMQKGATLGQALVWDGAKFGPGGGAGAEVGYDEITAPVSVTSVTEATGTSVIACAAHTFDGNPVIVEFYTPFAAVNVASSGVMIVSLFEAGTQIGRLGKFEVNALAEGTTFKGRFTPSAASHTYTVTAHATNNSGNTIGAGAKGTGAYFPAYVRFTKV